MEISKLNELYSKIIQKYSFDEINTDKNNEVTREEILTLAYQDEDLRAELDDSDLELISEFITEEVLNIYDTDIEIQDVSNNNNIDNNTNSQTKTKCELKSMDEYLNYYDKRFQELYQKYDGNKEQILQYVKNNMEKFADVDGDGKIGVVDEMVWENYVARHNFWTASNITLWDAEKEQNGYEYVKAKLAFAKEIHDSTYKLSTDADNSIKYDFDDIENAIKLGEGSYMSKWSKVGVLTQIFEGSGKHLNVEEITKDENWAEILKKYIPNSRTYDKVKSRIEKEVLNSDNSDNNSDNNSELTNTVIKKYRELVYYGQHNLNSIDDLLDFCESYDIETVYDEFYEKMLKQVEVNCPEWKGRVSPSSLLIFLGPVLRVRGYDYMDGTSGARSKYSIFDDIENNVPITQAQVKEYVSCVLSYSKPQILYKHYIQSADLSKEELTEILNKINSASASVQSKLAEVKKAVEEKLEAMS